ncbi:MAG: hypothetical protein NVS4B2_00870 [Chloroflexota bacterium]
MERLRQVPDEEEPLDREPLHQPFLPLLSVVAVSLLLRVPSLWDPPWVNDEGTYFAVAQTMSHGFRLYVNVWENKPPALYLLYLGVYHTAGPSLLAVRLLASGAAAGLICLVWKVGRLFLAAGHAPIAALVAGAFLAVPFLEGTTANAEIFLALLSVAAVYLVLGTERAMAAGLASALAILFKVVAAFDVVAIVLWLFLHQRWKVFPYVLGLTATLVLAAACAAAAGILPALIRDAFLYDLGYVGHANGGGIPWVAGIKAGVLVSATAAVRRAAFPYLWLLYALAGALVSGRLFGHYLVQAMAPCALVVAMQFTRTRLRRAVIVLLGGYVTLAGMAGACGWLLSATGHDSILARRLQYYPNFARYILGTETSSQYRDQIDDHVNRNIRIAAALRALPPGKIVVWGNIPWVYVLSGRLPATPYTSALRTPEVPGETEPLRAAVQRASVVAVVVVTPPMPPLGPASGTLNRRYRVRATVSDARVYVASR